MAQRSAQPHGGRPLRRRHRRTGFFLLAGAWRVLFKAQKEGVLATSGLYAQIRHPQYAAFIVIMTGFLFQWPTLVTLVMFPILGTVYVRLAHREEREVASEFGDM